MAMWMGESDQPTQLIHCTCGCNTKIPPLVGRCTASQWWGAGPLEARLINACMAAGMQFIPVDRVYVDVYDTFRNFNISQEGRIRINYSQIASWLMGSFAQMGGELSSAALRYCVCGCNDFLPPTVAQCPASAVWALDAAGAAYIHAANAVGVMVLPIDASIVEVHDTYGHFGLSPMRINLDELRSWLPRVLGRSEDTGMYP